MVVIAKVSDDGKQKRITIPKQDDTLEWEHGDIIKLEKVVIE